MGWKRRKARRSAASSAPEVGSSATTKARRQRRQTAITTTGPGHAAPIAYPFHDGCGGPLLVALIVGAAVETPLYCGRCHTGVEGDRPTIEASGRAHQADHLAAKRSAS